jgi:hypothetical protein
VALAALALAGCGGSAASEEAPVDVVEAAITGFGTTQAVRCEDAGELEVRGERVVRCSFEEEEDVSGVMRAKGRCYVVEDGEVIDVTRELPVGTTCSVSSP